MSPWEALSFLSPRQYVFHAKLATGGTGCTTTTSGSPPTFGGTAHPWADRPDWKPTAGPSRGPRVMLTDVQRDSSEEDEAHIRFMQQDAEEGWVPPSPISRSPPENRWQSSHPLRNFENRKRGHCASDEHCQPEGAEVFEVHPEHVLFFQIDDMPSGSSSPLLVERPLTDEDKGTSKAFPEVKGDGAMMEHATDSSGEEYQIPQLRAPQLFFCQPERVGIMVPPRRKLLMNRDTKVPLTQPMSLGNLSSLARANTASVGSGVTIHGSSEHESRESSGMPSGGSLDALDSCEGGSDRDT